MLKILLGLRNNAHKVEVIQPNDETRPVIGKRSPEETNRRLNAAKQWDVRVEAPRQPSLSTIDQPLDQRSQTILSYQVSATMRQQLNGGHGKLADSRRHNQKGSTEARTPIQTKTEETD
ncbi:hypothetical protein [Undibacterium sp. Xuan67W]|uniref:hypothetical protein n=1 Tax=Undibacterium sp. Xuan67W TaxID=3413057 RepID=UPI003BEFB4F5